jgi:SAM-dependent methyltransferase
MTFVRYNRSRDRYTVDDRQVALTSRLSTRWLLETIEQVAPFAQGRLLDIGCGKKPYRQLFDASEHIGTDHPASPHGPDWTDVYADAAHQPFSNESFDTVVATEVLEHLPEPLSALTEWRRLLRPGGHLILSVPFIHGLHETPRDFYRYTPFALEFMLGTAGLRLVDLRTRGGSLSAFTHVYAHASSQVMRSLLRRLRLPKKMTSSLLWLTVAAPQHVAARLLLTKRRRLKRIARRLDPSERMTLGYTVVAERCDLSEDPSTR